MNWTVGMMCTRTILIPRKLKSVDWNSLLKQKQPNPTKQTSKQIPAQYEEDPSLDSQHHRHTCTHIVNIYTQTFILRLWWKYLISFSCSIWTVHYHCPVYLYLTMPWSTFTTPASFPSLCKPPFYSQRLIRWTYLQSICDWIHVLLLLCLAYSTQYNYLQVNTHWQKCQEFILYCGGDNIPLYVLTILALSTYQLMNPVVCLQFLSVCIVLTMKLQVSLHLRTSFPLHTATTVKVVNAVF